MIKKDFQAKNTNTYNLGGKVRLKILVAVFLMVTSLIFTQLVFANNLALDGQKLSSLQEEIDKLEIENTNLKVEIAEISSLSTLSEKAQESGFVVPTKVTVF